MEDRFHFHKLLEKDAHTVVENQYRFEARVDRINAVGILRLIKAVSVFRKHCGAATPTWRESRSSWARATLFNSRASFILLMMQAQSMNVVGATERVNSRRIFLWSFLLILQKKAKKSGLVFCLENCLI